MSDWDAAIRTMTDVVGRDFRAALAEAAEAQGRTYYDAGVDQGAAEVYYANVDVNGLGDLVVSTHGEKPSVVQLRTDEIDQSVLGPRVLAILEHMKAELQSGALVTIDQERTRVRLLPFARK